MQNIFPIEYINSRIESEICFNTINDLTDEKLYPIFLKSKSVQQRKQIIIDILSVEIKSEKIKQRLLDKILIQIIPAGTKGVIRGNKFNEIVKEKIMNMNLDNEKFQICFEKECSLSFERPDWYIIEKMTKKILIGMNQIDIWSGGQQLNRGSKYLNSQFDNVTQKQICVVCNHVKIKKNTKIQKLFSIGFKNNTLCYLNNLPNIIKSYFNIFNDSIGCKDF